MENLEKIQNEKLETVEKMIKNKQY